MYSFIFIFLHFLQYIYFLRYFKFFVSPEKKCIALVILLEFYLNLLVALIHLTPSTRIFFSHVTMYYNGDCFYRTLPLFLFHLLPSPMHPNGFPISFFPGFLAIFILLTSQQQPCTLKSVYSMNIEIHSIVKSYDAQKHIEKNIYKLFLLFNDNKTKLQGSQRRY